MSIFTDIALQIVQWIESLGWIGVLIGILIESLIAPIPSPLIPMAAGFILVPININIVEVTIHVFILIGLVGSIGVTIGATLGFGIGYIGGKPMVQRFEKFLGVSWDEIEAFGNKFETGTKTGLLIFTLRAIPIIPLSIISIAAGAVRVEWKRFYFWTFIGGLPRCFSLGMLGWVLGATYGGVVGLINSLEDLILIFTVLLVVFLFIIQKIRNKQMRKYLKLDQKQNDAVV